MRHTGSRSGKPNNPRGFWKHEKMQANLLGKLTCKMGCGIILSFKFYNAFLEFEKKRNTGYWKESLPVTMILAKVRRNTRGGKLYSLHQCSLSRETVKFKYHQEQWQCTDTGDSSASANLCRYLSDILANTILCCLLGTAHPVLSLVVFWVTAQPVPSTIITG